MNFFRNLMKGRYGVDALSIVMLVLSWVLLFIPSVFVNVFSMLLLAVSVYRVFSKNIMARQKENAVLMRLFYSVKNFFVRNFGRRSDAKTHRRFKCKNCGQMLRVPKGKGKVIVTCPSCGHKITKKT